MAGPIDMSFPERSRSRRGAPVRFSVTRMPIAGAEARLTARLWRNGRVAEAGEERICSRCRFRGTDVGCAEMQGRRIPVDRQRLTQDGVFGNILLYGWAAAGCHPSMVGGVTPP